MHVGRYKDCTSENQFGGSVFRRRTLGFFMWYSAFNKFRNSLSLSRFPSNCVDLDESPSSNFLFLTLSWWFESPMISKSLFRVIGRACVAMQLAHAQPANKSDSCYLLIYSKPARSPTTPPCPLSLLKKERQLHIIY
jgi:hypothetical protein